MPAATPPRPPKAIQGIMDGIAEHGVDYDTDKVEALPQPDDFTVACGITLFGGPQSKALKVILTRLFPGKGTGGAMYTKLLELSKKHKQVEVMKICAFKRAAWLVAPALDWRKHAPTVAAHCTCSDVQCRARMKKRASPSPAPATPVAALGAQPAAAAGDTGELANFGDCVDFLISELENAGGGGGGAPPAAATQAFLEEQLGFDAQADAEMEEAGEGTGGGGGMEDTPESGLGWATTVTVSDQPSLSFPAAHSCPGGSGSGSKPAGGCSCSGGPDFSGASTPTRSGTKRARTSADGRMAEWQSSPGTVQRQEAKELVHKERQQQTLANQRREARSKAESTELAFTIIIPTAVHKGS